MPKTVKDGGFYEFSRDEANAHYEVGREIQRNQALMNVRFNRGDVYTPRGSDAKSLAKDVVPLPPEWHPAHSYSFYPHYFPYGKDGFSHIFYGQKGDHFEPVP